MTHQPFFILIVRAQKYFDLNFKIKERFTFKFLIVRENYDNAPWQMLLMVEGKPYVLHSQGLLHYMQESKLHCVVVNGGGYITFSKTMKAALIEGTSETFGPVQRKEIRRILRQAVPTINRVTLDCVKIDAEAVKNCHRVWTLGEMMKETIENYQ